MNHVWPPRRGAAKRRSSCSGRAPLLVALALVAGEAGAQEAAALIARPELAVPEARAVATPRARPERERRREPAAPKESVARDAERLFVREIRLAGAATLERDKLQGLLARVEGRSATLAELEAVAAAVAARYRDEGYILASVFIPPQEVSDGVVTLEVVEGRVGGVDIRAETPALERRLRRLGERLLALRPFDVRRLETELLLLRDLPGVTAGAVLEPIPGVPGAARVTLEAEQDALEGWVSLDNGGSDELGPVRLNVAATANGLLAPSGATSVQGAVALPPPQSSEIAYAAIEHAQRLGDRGAAVTVGASWTRTRPSGVLEELDFESRSVQADVALSLPIVRRRALSASLTGGLGWIATETELLDETLTEDRLWTASAGVEVDVADAFGATRVALQGSHGLGSPRTAAASSRADGEPDFWLAAGEAARLQGLGERTSLFAAARGQYAFSPLLAPLEIGFGGGQIGRAFDPSAILGETGAGLLVELRYDDPLPGAEALGLTAFASLDGAAVWEEDRDRRDVLGSAAVGLRADLPRGLFAEVQLASGVALGEGEEREEETRTTFRLTKRF